MNFKPANNRIILLDIVRGLAILGILLVNMLFFHYLFAGYSIPIGIMAGLVGSSHTILP